MPYTYIVDTNPSAQADASTFGTFSEVITHILNTHGFDLTSGGNAGLVTINFRNSSGVPLVECVNFNGFFVDGTTNRIEIVGQIAGGYPAILADDPNDASDNVLNINDDNIDVRAEEEDAFIIRGSLDNTTAGKILLTLSKNMDVLSGLVLDGLDSGYYAGIGGTGTATASNLKILRCKRDFYGAIRNGNVALDHCTINGCAMIRTSGVMTNTLVVDTPLSGGDGIKDGSDYNAYELAKVDINYVGSATDTNSFFSLDLAANLVADPVGGYNLTAGSILTNAGSDGTNIGAFATGLVGNPPVISINTSGDTLTATVSDDTTPSPSLQLYIDGVAAGTTQTSTSWDMTSYGLTTGVYRLTVQATDNDSNISTSNQKYYSVGNVLKILWIGNSLTQTPIEPINSTHSVIELVQEMFTANGSQVFIEGALLGGAAYKDHNANKATHDAIASGNYDIVLSQHEAKAKAGYADYQDYLDKEMRPLQEAANAVGSDWVVWSHQPYGNDTQETYDTQQGRMASAQTWYPTMQLINNMSSWWNVRNADPTIDMYADNIHQNAGGAYLSALSVYKFLTGSSVNTMSYEDPILTATLGDSGLGYTAQQVQTLKTQADTTVTNQFVRSAVNTCTITMTSPAGAVSVTEGDQVTFTATAIDSSTGDLSSGIVWKVGDTLLHTGNTFNNTSLPTGKLLITAERIGSDGKTSVAARNVTVRTLVNAAPVATNGTRTVDFNSDFTQVNLASLITDDNDEIDYNTLTIVQQPANGVATKDGQTLSTINLNYSGTNYVGQDTFTYSVADLDGLVSNVATITLTVNPQNPPTGQIAGATIVRGNSFDVVMTNYTAYNSGDTSRVEVYVFDGTTEHPCTVTVNSDSLITATAPSTTDIPNTVANAEVRIKAINGYT